MASNIHNLSSIWNSTVFSIQIKVFWVVTLYSFVVGY